MSQKKDPKTGKWFYYGAYVDDSGIKHQYKKRGFNSQREANKAEIKFRESVEDGTVIQKSKTFESVSNEFILTRKKRIKESTYITHMETLSKLNDEIGSMQVNKLSVSYLQSYIDNLDAQFSKKYVQRIYYLINQILNYSVEHNYIRVNQLKKVKVDARKNEIKKEVLFWEPDQFIKFINYVDDLTYKSFFSFLYYMGCRRGEALALQWKDIDFENRTVQINKTVSYKVAPYTITPPKTSNSTRTISMPLSLIEILTVLYQEHMHLYEFNENRFVFGYVRPLAPETVRRTFNKYIDTCNENKEAVDQIPKIRLHDLRHSHASYLINNKSDKFTDYDIARRLGDTVQTLHDTYAHWFKSADKGIIDFMDEDLSNKKIPTLN